MRREYHLYVLPASLGTDSRDTNIEYPTVVVDISDLNAIHY